MAILRSHHFAFKTGQLATMKAFYTEPLGFKIVGQIPGKEVYFINLGGTTLEMSGVEAQATGEPPACGLVHMAFEVDDVDQTYEELKAKGVEFFITPRNAGDIRLAFFKDPDGNQLELFRSPSLTWA